MNKQVVKFLDYEIVNTGNGDGWVLKKARYTHKNLWECHLGNYSTAEAAMPYAIQYFMAARPDKFASWVVARMNGEQLYMDYYKFIHVLKEEGIEIPEGISASNNGNMTLMYRGKEI